MFRFDILIIFRMCLLLYEYAKIRRETGNFYCKKVDIQPLIIDIPKASDTGSVTVKDADGNIYFRYTGKIDIQNGENIDVVVIVPSEEETESTDDN